MEGASSKVLRVCLVTPYPPQQKGAAEYANMVVEALHGSPFQRRLELHIISEITEKCPRGQMLLYSPQENFVLKRVYPDKFPWNNFSFLGIFRAVLKVRPHVVHFYWPGGYGGFLGDFTGETLLILFVLLRLLSIKILVTMHAVWLPRFAEQEAFKRVNSRIVAKAVKAYFFTFMFIFCHLVNKILIGVVREQSATTRRFARSYRMPNGRVGEEPAGCLEIERRDFGSIREIKRKLNLAGKKVVLCFGFIRSDKGLEYAVEALSETVKSDQNVSLVIAGRAKSGEDRLYLSKLKELVKELGLEGYVVFDNRFIPLGEVIDYYSIAEVLVLPYIEHVGFSGPLNMAISLGVPVIATRVGEQMPGLTELVRLVPPRDVEALRDALNEVLSDAVLRDKMRMRLLSHVSKYSWPNVAKRLFRAYVSLVE